MVINPFILHSMPLVTDLLETCVDEVLRAPVPMATAEEVGPGGAYATASTATEETLSLTGELIHLRHSGMHWQKLWTVFVLHNFFMS